MALPSAEALHAEIVKACKACGGKGYSLKPTAKGVSFVDCECMTKLKRSLAYLRIGLPDRYWDFDHRHLIDEFKTANKTALWRLKTWSERLVDYMIPHGAGLLLWSPEHGAAKSALAAVVAKQAMDAGVAMKWFDGSDLHQALTHWQNDDEENLNVLEVLNEVKFVVIDEVDKIYIPTDKPDSRIRSTTCEFFDRIYRQRIAVLATGNLRESVDEKSPDIDALPYPSSIKDRMSEWDYIRFAGSSYRRGVSHLTDVIRAVQVKS